MDKGSHGGTEDPVRASPERIHFTWQKKDVTRFFSVEASGRAAAAAAAAAATEVALHASANAAAAAAAATAVALQQQQQLSPRKQRQRQWRQQLFRCSGNSSRLRESSGL